MLLVAVIDNPARVRTSTSLLSIMARLVSRHQMVVVVSDTSTTALDTQRFTSRLQQQTRPPIKVAAGPAQRWQCRVAAKSAARNALAGGDLPVIGAHGIAAANELAAAIATDLHADAICWLTDKGGRVTVDYVVRPFDGRPALTANASRDALQPLAESR